MLERPLLRDFALVAAAAVLGWWAHSIDTTVNTAIARAYKTHFAVQFDGGANLQGSVVFTASSCEHSIRISLRSGQRTA